MSDTYLSRLQWIKPQPPEVAGHGLADTWGESMTPSERALIDVGLPVGETPADRASPLAEARFLLRAAAEIEHGLLAQYLYAAYSCTDHATALLIVEIAREEMGHLISVQNLLLAVGGHPYFGRDDYPTAPVPGHVFPFAMAYEPLSVRSLAKYVVAESPPLDEIADVALRARVQKVIDVTNAMPNEPINHVGALYLALYWIFKKDDTPPTDQEWEKYPTDMVLGVYRDSKLKRTNWHLADGDLAGKATLGDIQADNDLEDWNKGNDAIYVHAVKFAADGTAQRGPMLDALSKIAAQGEGWNTQDNSHFLRFLGLFEKFQALEAAGTPLPVSRVPIGPSTVAPPAPARPPEGLIGNPEANLWARIFNVRYRIALLKLSLALASPRSGDTGTASGRAALIEDAIAVEMRTNLRTLATALVRMRRRGITSDGPEPLRAAPPFELPRGSLPDLVGLDPDPSVAAKHAVAALKAALKDALVETAGLVSELTTHPAGDLDTPAPRPFLTDVMVPADQDLLAALG